jgi:Tfp pilus assembly protein FimT
LAVFVGQQRALALAVRDWRRTTRQTALAGLLTEELRFSRPDAMHEESAAEDVAEDWEGLLDAPAESPS